MGARVSRFKCQRMSETYDIAGVRSGRTTSLRVQWLPSLFCCAAAYTSMLPPTPHTRTQTLSYAPAQKKREVTMRKKTYLTPSIILLCVCVRAERGGMGWRKGEMIQVCTPIFPSSSPQHTPAAAHRCILPPRFATPFLASSIPGGAPYAETRELASEAHRKDRHAAQRKIFERHSHLPHRSTFATASQGVLAVLTNPYLSRCSKATHTDGQRVRNNNKKTDRGTTSHGT